MMAAAVGEANIGALIKKARIYHRDSDTALLQRAFHYAAEKHEGQTRRSGELYITHPIAVAEILAELEMDDATLAAGLLHDVIEDCGVSREEIAAQFGTEIADLVDGVTKLKLADFESRSDPNISAIPEPDGPEHAARKKRHGETNKSAFNLRKILLHSAEAIRRSRELLAETEPLVLPCTEARVAATRIHLCWGTSADGAQPPSRRRSGQRRTVCLSIHAAM